jgi:hypothetical protein
MPQTKERPKPRSIFWRYQQGLMSQAPNVSRKRVQNMREAMNRELKSEGVPAFQRRQADQKLLSTAKQALTS